MNEGGTPPQTARLAIRLSKEQQPCISIRVSKYEAIARAANL